MTARPSAAKSPSMADVASHAGVSAQTVSRVLRGHPYVTESTRERVLAAVDDLGYRMNAAAKALSSGRTRTIGAVLMATDSYAAAATHANLDLAAAALDYSMVSTQVATLDNSAIASAVRRLMNNGAEGLILALPLSTPDLALDALTKDLPTVSIGGTVTSTARALEIDQRLVGRLATEHLLELGHTRIAHLTGPPEWADATARAAGCREALAAAGAPEPVVLHGDWSPESGYAAAADVVAAGVSAVFSASDEMSFGLLRGLADEGVAVPADVSVVSVDDVHLAAYAHPPLTTVSQPFDDLCAAAVASVTARLEGQDDPTTGFVLRPQLVVRTSSGSAPTGDRATRTGR